MKHRVIIIVFLICCIFFLPSCNENESNDPRDPFIGSYNCKVTYENHLEPGHFLYKPDTIYFTTLIVSKHEIASFLEITGGTHVQIEINFHDFTFNGADYPGQRLWGRFLDDSIFMNTFMTPAALISWTYEGKKIN